MRLLLTVIVLTAGLSACGSIAAPPMTEGPPPSVRVVSLGQPQVTSSGPTQRARVWQILTAVSRPRGVVVLGIDNIAINTVTHEAIPGTLALARVAVTWGRTVIYLTTNADPSRVRADLQRAGFPSGELWTPKTAPWCGRHRSAEEFRAACIGYEARRHDVILWLTQGQQLRNAADRTYAFG